MPERVTREERKISMAIQKARDAKEALYHSLMDNNRSPMDDESEHVKLKRPKAENYTYKKESNDGPTTLHAYAGEITKMFSFMKSIGDFTWGNMIVNTDKDADYLLDELQEFIIGDEKTQRIFLSKLHRAAEDYKRTLQKAVRESDYETNPFLDEEDRKEITEAIAELDASITQLSEDYKSAKPDKKEILSNMITTLSRKVSNLEKLFRRLPEPRNEESGEALDPDYDEFMQR